MSDEHNHDDEGLDISMVFTQSQPGALPVTRGTAPTLSGFATVPATGKELAEPIRLGRYTLLHLLGKGGMAEVYLAKQDGPAGFEKTCVVKRIRKVLTEEQKFIDMFLREARVAARLNHANVVQIFELGQEGNEYFIAMEYLDGLTLHRAARRCWVNEESIPMEVILRTIADAAQGLHHAHTLKDAQRNPSPLIHRDISPDNLLLTRDGVTKVLDFGIAKGAESDEVTRTGELKGKIPYMSPEQIKGEPLDGRSDLWALGVTFYWLLTGRRPFDGGTDHMTIDRILRAEPTPPRDLNPLIPPSVQKLVMSLLVKDVSGRMTSGAQLHDALVGMLGPAAGTGPSSEFAEHVLTLPPREKELSSGSVITVVAARPQTNWLKRVGEGMGDLERLIPEPTPTSGPNRASIDMRPRAEPDTIRTVTGADLPASPAERKKSGLFAAAIGFVGVLLLGVGAWVVIGGDDGPRIVAQPEAPVEPTSTKPPAAAPPPPAADPTKAATDPAADPAAPNGDQTSTAAQADDTADKPSAKEPPRKPPKKTAKARGAVGTVKTKGPASVRWSLTNGKKVGKGSGSVRVPKGTSALFARDVVTGGRVKVPVNGGVADYDGVGKGALMLRVRPWAKASVGSKKLGTTPIDAVRLPAGRYTVTLTWESKTVKKTVNLQKGRQTVLKVDMRKE